MLESVLVGMSGGVDSSVTLALLKEAGYDASGATLVMFENEDIGLDPEDEVCGSKIELAAAKKLAESLNVPHYAVDESESFCEGVMKYFADSYQGGETPNPCAVCNKLVKFPSLLKEADRLGIQKVATGHYARVVYDKDAGKYKLYAARDRKKDQSYFLYKLGQEELARILFPLGEFTKSEIREKAKARGMEVADKKDSQDICFVKGRSYVDFLTDVMDTPLIVGDFVSDRGEVLGRHEGFISYTIGQRKGLGVTFGKPMYVLKKNKKDFSITLGEEEKLFASEMLVTEVNSVSREKFCDGMQVWVKARNTAKRAKATICRCDNENGKMLRIVFSEAQRALTKGQSAVFYSGPAESEILEDNEVIGGGRIYKTIK